MAIQMYDKKTGDSKIVDDNDVRQHLKMGWTYFKPKNVEVPKSKATKKVVKTAKVQKEPTNEPAESSLVFEAEATAEVIKPTNQKEN